MPFLMRVWMSAFRMRAVPGLGVECQEVNGSRSITNKERNHPHDDSWHNGQAEQRFTFTFKPGYVLSNKNSFEMHTELHVFLEIQICVCCTDCLSEAHFCSLFDGLTFASGHRNLHLYHWGGNYYILKSFRFL